MTNTERQVIALKSQLRRLKKLAYKHGILRTPLNKKLTRPQNIWWEPDLTWVDTLQRRPGQAAQTAREAEVRRPRL